MSDAATAEAREIGGRRVVVSEFVTLDGYMVGPDEDMSWVAEGFDPQMQDDIAEDLSRTFDLFVFGRVTYDIFAACWPHALPYDEGDELKPAEGKEDPRIIRALNDRPKLVFSTTLGEPGWANTRVVAGGMDHETRRLKHEPGKAIGIQGSASIVQAPARADLIDEYRRYVHPVLLGDGKPLFPAGHDRQDLELTRLTRYANGVIATTYEIGHYEPVAGAPVSRLQVALDRSLEAAAPFTRALFESDRWTAAQVADFINDTRSITVASVTRAGAPHAAVVIGSCLDDDIHFTVAPRSLLARNLRHSDRIAFTCANPSHAVMGSGTAVHVSRSLDDLALIERLASVSRGGTFAPPGWDGEVYRVAIERIFAS